MLIRSLRVGALLAAVVAATAVFASVASVLGTDCGVFRARPVDLAAILHLLWL